MNAKRLGNIGMMLIGGTFAGLSGYHIPGTVSQSLADSVSIVLVGCLLGFAVSEVVWRLVIDRDDRFAYSAVAGTLTLVAAKSFVATLRDILHWQADWMYLVVITAVGLAVFLLAWKLTMRWALYLVNILIGGTAIVFCLYKVAYSSYTWAAILWALGGIGMAVVAANMFSWIDRRTG